MLQSDSTTKSKVTKEVDNIKVVKRRRKPPKSCSFCRKRKLKCDQKKPICSNCLSRKFDSCLYPDSFLNNDVSRPDNTIYERHTSIIDLSTKSGADTTDSSAEIKNPFRNYYFLQCKSDGRRILYGPTSSRTFIMRNNWGFMEKFRQLWSKVKIERDKWKSRTHTKMAGKFNDLETVEFENINPVSNINAVIEFLPNYDHCLQLMNEFFDSLNSDLYEISGALDKQKVLNDLKISVITDEDNNIIKLIPTGKKNYYKIGVIIMILNLTHFKHDIPKAIQKFLVCLTGASSSKLFYMERVQFLLLRYYYNSLYTSAGDDTYLVTLVESLTAAALRAGLHLNIKTLYHHQESVVGNLVSLENLWTWILLFDFKAAVHVGCPLNISCSEFYDFDEKEHLENFEQAYYPSTDNVKLSPNTHDIREYAIDKSFYGKIRRFLNLARPMITEIHNKNCVPNMIDNCDKLIKFLETEFSPINNFTDEILMAELPICEFKHVLCVLDLMSTFYSLNFVILSARSIKLKNSATQSFLIGLQICRNLLKKHMRWINLDFQNISKMMFFLPPYLTIITANMTEIMGKQLSIFHAFHYLHATLFENGIFLSEDMLEIDWDLSTLHVPIDKPIPMGTEFKLYKNILDGGLQEQEIKEVLSRSYPFMVVLSLERVYRAVVKNAFEYRKRVEKSWLSNNNSAYMTLPASRDSFLLHSKKQREQFVNDHHTNYNEEEQEEYTEPTRNPEPTVFQLYQKQQDHYIKSLNTKKAPLNRKEPKRDKEHMSVPSFCFPSDINSDFTTTESHDQTENSYEQSSASEGDNIKTLADEFWTSYNVGWEQLLDETDTSLFFGDL
ncbi:hypothetical protein KAFR_0G02520 [Kazachstania africana CBS 2517]|uniref:Zn(2)-C6 fungal-type domain-containing protein n=1 Tax=Kazachstania africana (strain ATCC 22294 / BCRC 22015 / CBS 2517 / CECT 1963 / NBRC 1671 / NRRL Y-8276) TaxID=1071382 RepID=H2AY35_KAZAF|nr:hypothetical protein KAFR_0G02520 [Kazachstania africana CBS 2517]CCF59285.1 hypothetical protein KAFR_0G02520 [Kazachstania africana CBS 2517]